MKKVAGGEEEEERKPHLTPCSLSLSLPFSLFLLALQCACGAVSTEQERGGGRGDMACLCSLGRRRRRGNTWGKKGRGGGFEGGDGARITVHKMMPYCRGDWRETDSIIFHGKDGEDVECARCFSDCVVLDGKGGRGYGWLALPLFSGGSLFVERGVGQKPSSSSSSASWLARTWLRVKRLLFFSPPVASATSSSSFSFPSPHLKGQEERERERHLVALKASSSSSSPLLAAQTNPSFTLFLFYLRLFSFFPFSAGLHSEKEGKEENGHTTLVVPYLNPSILFHLLPCRFRHLKWGRPKFSFLPFPYFSLSLFSGLPLGGKNPDRQTECGPLVEKSGLPDVGWAVHSSCRGGKR